MQYSNNIAHAVIINNNICCHSSRIVSYMYNINTPTAASDSGFWRIVLCLSFLFICLNHPREMFVSTSEPRFLTPSKARHSVKTTPPNEQKFSSFRRLYGPWKNRSTSRPYVPSQGLPHCDAKNHHETRSAFGRSYKSQIGFRPPSRKKFPIY